MNSPLALSPREGSAAFSDPDVSRSPVGEQVPPIQAGKKMSGHPMVTRGRKAQAGPPSARLTHSAEVDAYDDVTASQIGLPVTLYNSVPDVNSGTNAHDLMFVERDPKELTIAERFEVIF